VILKCELEVIQGHWKWRRRTDDPNDTWRRQEAPPEETVPYWAYDVSQAAAAAPRQTDRRRARQRCWLWL